MDTWKLPPPIKVYEALGAVADGRVELTKDGAKVTSSSGNKFYTVAYKGETAEIAANDNASYWVGYLGYPSLAYLLRAGKLPFDPSVASWLEGIPWKDINTRFKNNYPAVLKHVRSLVQERHPAADLTLLDAEVDDVLNGLESLNLRRGPALGRPPAGY